MLISSLVYAYQLPGSRNGRTAQDIMNRQVRTVGPDLPIREAARFMLETGLRRLPVVEVDGRLAGMLTREDLLQAILTSPLMSPQASSATQPLQRTAPLTDLPPPQRPVSDYTRPEATVAEQTSLSEVIDALILSPLKRVVVIDTEGQVKGIISDVDVLSQMQEEVRPGLLGTLAGWARSKPGRLPTATLQTSHGKARIAADLMNRDVVTVNEMTSVQVTIERMMTTRPLFITVGFLGTYTTFSSLALSDSALLYLALSITGGVLAALLGDWLSLWLFSKTRRTARRSMTTRTLTQQLSAHPQGKRVSTVHFDV